MTLRRIVLHLLLLLLLLYLLFYYNYRRDMRSIIIPYFRVGSQRYNLVR